MSVANLSTIVNGEESFWEVNRVDNLNVTYKCIHFLLHIFLNFGTKIHWNPDGVGSIISLLSFFMHTFFSFQVLSDKISLKELTAGARSVDDIFTPDNHKFTLVFWKVCNDSKIYSI